MDPDVIEAIADIVESLVTPVVVMVVTTGVYFTARVWRRHASAADLEVINEKLDTLLARQDTAQRELTEMSDRLEFAERLLTRSQQQ